MEIFSFGPDTMDLSGGDSPTTGVTLAPAQLLRLRSVPPTIRSDRLSWLTSSRLEVRVSLREVRVSIQVLANSRTSPHDSDASRHLQEGSSLHKRPTTARA